MVTPPFSYSCFRLPALLISLLLLILIAGCAPAVKVSLDPAFHPVPEKGLVYVVPFVSVLVPEAFSSEVFNDLVDNLNAGRDRTGVQWFFILKQDVNEIDPSWLARQVYITGEFWSYRENSGCCSTELSARGRAFIHIPGQAAPAGEITVPAESFFDHDQTTVEIEKTRLARHIAHQLSTRILSSLVQKQ